MAKSDCGRCVHVIHVDCDAGKWVGCAITKCPLVIRDEVLEEAYKKVMDMWSVAHEEGYCGDICEWVADRIRAMKRER